MVEILSLHSFLMRRLLDTLGEANFFAFPLFAGEGWGTRFLAARCEKQILRLRASRSAQDDNLIF